MTITTAERWMIAAGIGLAMLLSRGFVLVLIAVAGAPSGMDMLIGTLGLAFSLLLPLPLCMDVIEQSARWKSSTRLLAHAFCAISYVVVSGGVTAAWAAIAQPAETDPSFAWSLFLANIPGAILIYSTAIGIVRALQWYRASVVAEAARVELESTEVQRTRLLLERRYRPATIVAVLRRLQQTLAIDRDAATRLLHQLARYARLLLRGSGTRRSFQSDLRSMRAALALRGIATDVSIDRSAAALETDDDALPAAIESAAAATQPASIAISGSDTGQQIVRISAAGASAHEFADLLMQTLSSGGFAVVRVDAVAVDVPLPRRSTAAPPTAPQPASPRASRSLSLTLLTMVLGYGISSTILDLRAAPFGAILPMSRIFSFIVWTLAGPLLVWLSGRLTRWRLSVAVTAAISVSIASALVVTAIVQFALVMAGISDRQPVLLLYDAFYILMRNLLIGLALMAMAFAYALGGVLLARNRAAARLRNDAALAESREIEARFHPHFLFNTLTLIAFLIDEDPRAAMAMCRRLAGLVEKTVASAGVERWTVREEIELAADYLAVQMMRFSNRLRIETWDISTRAADAVVPRLVLQPLLENAFKHGVACNIHETAIGLTVKKRGAAVAMTLWNDLGSHASGTVSGRGLPFVRRRLEQAGGDITIEKKNGRFVVQVVAPA